MYADTPPQPPSRLPGGKPRIAVLMLNSPNIPHYAHYAAMNNYLYASQRGYDFIVERYPANVEEEWCWDSENEYKLVWYKAEFLYRHLKNYHYVLFIDSDAVVLDFSMSIEKEVIGKFSDAFSLVFQEDVWKKRAGTDHPKKICTGLICAKNARRTFEILDLWIRAPHTHTTCFQYRNKHAREQDCYQHLHDTVPAVKSGTLIYPCKEGLFGQYDASWIFHMGGVNTCERYERLYDIFKKAFRTFQESAIAKYKTLVQERHARQAAAAPVAP